MIKMYALPQGPADWAVCDGRLLNVADYPQLFAAIGNQFGGDGTATFALPTVAPNQAGHFLIRMQTGEEAAAAFRGTLSQIVLYAPEGEPAGWLPCDGRVLSHTDYPELSVLMQQSHMGDAGFGLPNIPDENGVRYLICVEGINPLAEEDDDDY